MSKLILSTKMKRSREQLLEDYQIFEHDLAEDSSNHFRIAIGRNWKVVDIDQGPYESGLESVALFRRVESPLAEIEIFAAPILREVEPADWLDVFLLQREYQVVQQRRVEAPGGDNGDFLCTRELQGTKFAYRTMAIKDGDRIMAVQCRVAESDYATVDEEFLMALQTFCLLHPSDQLYAEPLATYPIPRPVPAAFQFPASWSMKIDDDAPVASTAFTLQNQREDAVVGQMTVLSIPRSYEESHRALLESYLDELRKGGVEISSADVTEKDTPSTAAKVRQGSLSAARSGVPIVVYFATVEHPGAWTLLAMLSPSRDSDIESHSLNRRAFGLCVESFEFTV